MTTFTPTIRLTEPAVGGDTGTWGAELNNDLIYIDRAVNQSVTVNIADTNISLTADGSNSDQARYLRYSFTGALTADRTVTLPANVKVGWASNNTSGGHNVILSAGGTTLKILNTGWTFFYCDGTNVTAPAVAVGGTITNDNAVAGTVGEYVSANVPVASAVSLSNNVVTNLTTISLTAGDWDVSCAVGFTTTGTVGTLVGGVSQISATLGDSSDMSFNRIGNASSFTTGSKVFAGPFRYSFSGTTTVYLLGQAGFSSGTVAAYGTIRARRIR